MIGDLICDRKDGQKYNAHDFYMGIMGYRETWPEWSDAITRAMDAGEEQDMQEALCKYIDEAGWNFQLKDYIRAVKWLEDDPEHSFEVKVTFPKDRLVDEQGRTEKQPFEFSFWQCYEEMAGGTTEQEQQEKTLAPFKKGIRLADKMGWELWLPITFEIPTVNGKWVMGPKDDKSAQWLKETLADAKKNHKPLRGEVVLKPTEQEPAKLIDAST